MDDRERLLELLYYDDLFIDALYVELEALVDKLITNCVTFHREVKTDFPKDYSYGY